MSRIVVPSIAALAAINSSLLSDGTIASIGTLGNYFYQTAPAPGLVPVLITPQGPAWYPLAGSRSGVGPPAVTTQQLLQHVQPTHVTGCSLWLPCDRLAAGAVSSFVDASGSGNTFSQATGATQPIATTTASPNGKMVLSFNGSQWMSAAAAVLPAVGWTLLMVVKASTTFQANQYPFSVGGASNGVGVEMLSNTNRSLVALASNVMQFQGQTSAWSGAAGGMVFSGSSAWEVWSITCAAGPTYTVRVNGIPLTLSQSSTPTAPSAASYIGTLNGGTSNWLGWLAEVICFNNAIAPDAALVMEAALAAKWGLTQPQIAFDGNSLVWGSGSSNHLTTSWVPVAMGTYPNTGWANNGIVGYTTPQNITNGAVVIDSQYSPYRTRNLLCAWECTNDIVANSASAATAYANYVSYCQARQAVGWEVYAMTVLPRSDASAPANFYAIRDQVNANIRANWHTFANGLIDVAADARIGPAGSELNGTYYSGDKIHLNDTGYAIVATIAENILTVALNN